MTAWFMLQGVLGREMAGDGVGSRLPSAILPRSTCRAVLRVETNHDFESKTFNCSSIIPESIRVPGTRISCPRPYPQHNHTRTCMHTVTVHTYVFNTTVPPEVHFKLFYFNIFSQTVPLNLILGRPPYRNASMSQVHNHTPSIAFRRAPSSKGRMQ